MAIWGPTAKFIIPANISGYTVHAIVDNTYEHKLGISSKNNTNKIVYHDALYNWCPASSYFYWVSIGGII